MLNFLAITSVRFQSKPTFVQLTIKMLSIACCVRVISATWYRWTRPVLTLAIKAGTWFTYRKGIKGWVDLGDCL